ncbi:MAG: helicase-associated domain-containing protein [Jiangellaceae bacterium]|nr:helicase-associated domain-containing protein [Jiangellaceae bacterium]
MTYTGWLRSLTADELAMLLQLRPDVASHPAPATMEELAQRLTTPRSIELALAGIDAVALQLAEMFAGLGALPKARLLEWFAESEPVRAALGELRRRGLIWEAGDGADRTLRPAGSLPGAFPQPLNLGLGLKQLLGNQQPDILEFVLQTLQLAARMRSPQHARQAIAEHLTAERIVALAVQAPPATAKLLDAAAWEAPTVVLDPQDASSLLWSGRFRRDMSGVAWAVGHALLLPLDWQMLQMPRDVALALRGPHWCPRILTERPALPTTAVDGDAVERESAAAVAAALGHVISVIDALATAPATELRTGGVGVREIRRLAKAAAAHEQDVALALEVARAAGLITIAGAAILPTGRYDEWRYLPPGERLAGLVRAWWSTDGPVTNRSNPRDDKPLSVLGRTWPYPEVRELRQAMLSRAVRLPAGTGVSSVPALLEDVRWDRPLAFPRFEVESQAADCWWETSALGLVAHGAVTALGRALAADEPAAVVAQATALLPAATAQATFQADLTAMASGTPDAALADLLDSAADREARSSAHVWRFSAASVRRYFDAGGAADDLLAALAAVSSQPLPQPLEYLVRDVARRHGTVGVQPVTCCVVSADEPLLAEIAAHRALRRLGLRTLAPTVLASGKPVVHTIEVLRSAGYAPVQLNASGAVVIERQPKQRAGQPQTGAGMPVAGRHPHPRSSRPDLPSSAAQYLTLATTLLEAGDETTSAQVDSLTLERLIAAGSGPPLAGLRVLSHAIDEKQAVHIDYVDQNGNRTSRVISEITLHGGMIEAWCHLRRADRWFSLGGIESVAPVA